MGNEYRGWITSLPDEAKKDNAKSFEPEEAYYLVLSHGPLQELVLGRVTVLLVMLSFPQGSC